MTPEQESDYREFVAARLDQLGRFAYLLCGDWHRAEDTVQAALTRLYLRWPRIELRSPDAYIRRIIANLLRDQRLRLWYRRERPSERLPDRAAPDPAEGTAGRLTMLAALARLPHRQRLAVTLRHWEDRPVEEVAEIMDCSPGTVKSQTARGLEALRALLRETSGTPT